MADTRRSHRVILAIDTDIFVGIRALGTVNRVAGGIPQIAVYQFIGGVLPNIQGVGGPYKIQGYTRKRGYISSINLFPNKEDLPYRVYKFYNSQDELTLAYKSGEINQFENVAI